MDADAEITEPEHSLDLYDILRDDPFALIPPEIVDQWDAKQKQIPPPHPQPQPPQLPDPTEVDTTLTAQPWSPETSPFTPPHIHVHDTEDFVSAESQSVRDPEDFRATDSEDEGSTDVSNHYRHIRWTEETPQLTQTEVDAEIEPGEEGLTSAVQDSRAPPPSPTPGPVTMIRSR